MLRGLSQKKVLPEPVGKSPLPPPVDEPVPEPTEVLHEPVPELEPVEKPSEQATS